MKEYDSVYSSIDSAIDTTPAMEDFMDSFATVLQEAQDYESFDAEDVIRYLRIRMSKSPLVKNQYYV